MSTSSQQVPSLTSWAQSHLGALFQPPSSSAVQGSNFDSTFSPKAQFIVNHNQISPDAAKQNLSIGPGVVADVQVEWKHISEVPDEEGDNAHRAGIVAGVVVTTRTLKLLVRAGPMKTQSVITFQAKIEQDPNAQPDEYGDRRRIVHLFQTAVHKPVPVNFASPKQD